MNEVTSKLPENAGQSKRNYGIDLLRLVAMFYVVVLHTLGEGAALGGSGRNLALSFGMETWTYCAVDCFALISGYVAFRPDKPEHYRFSAYFELYLQVVFYGLLVTVVYRLLGSELAASRRLLGAFLPVFTGEYWYFTAYTGLFILMPVINSGVQKMEPRLAAKSAVMILLVFVCCSTFYARSTERFILYDGYSVIWIVILYTLGATLRKSGLLSALPLRWLWPVNVLLVAVTARLASRGDPFLMRYVSCTVVLNALCHVALFSRLRLPAALEKLVRFGAPGAFAVYLLNTHPVFWLEFMEGRFQYLQESTPLRMVCTVLGFALAFVAVSVCIDAARQRLFRLAGIPKLTRWADAKLNRLLDRALSSVQ